MFDERLRARAAALVAAYAAAGLKFALAESCTGGLVAALITEIPGSSDALDRGAVVYSNAAKTEMLAVPASLIAAHGAVSEACARAMAEGMLARSHADVALSVTGIAGPGGGSSEKPVGLVHFAVAARGAETRVREERFGDRPRGVIRIASVAVALSLLDEALQARDKR